MISELSNHAAHVDRISLVLILLSGLIVVTVWALIIYFCYRYRQGSKASRDRRPQRVRRLEMWTAGATFVFGLCIFIWSASVFYEMYLPPKNAHTIYVVAKQWMWTFHSPDGEDQINRLVVPENHPIELVMTSEDVIHSFYIPALRIKQDVLPGRYTSLWFEAKKTGEFEILCTQYCGLNHSAMRATLEVIPQAEFDQRFASSKKTGVSSAAFKKFGCIGCHGTGGTVAPELNHLFGKQVKLTSGASVVADEEYIRRSIVNPSADIVAGYPNVMPSFQGQMDEDEIRQLIAYIKSLENP